MDGSNKQYKIEDIDNITIANKSEICFMKLYRNGILSAEFSTKSIDKMIFELDSSKIKVLSIYVANIPKQFLITEIDSICFNYIKPPKILSILPSSGKINDEITITGSDFGAIQGSSKVTFTGADAMNINDWNKHSNSLKSPVRSAKWQSIFIS